MGEAVLDINKALQAPKHPVSLCPERSLEYTYQRLAENGNLDRLPLSDVLAAGAFTKAGAHVILRQLLSRQEEWRQKIIADNQSDPFIDEKHLPERDLHRALSSTLKLTMVANISMEELKAITGPSENPVLHDPKTVIQQSFESVFRQGHLGDRPLSDVFAAGEIIEQRVIDTLVSLWTLQEFWRLSAIDKEDTDPLANDRNPKASDLSTKLNEILDKMRETPEVI